MKFFFVFVDKLDRRLRLLISVVLAVLVFFLSRKDNSEGLPYLYSWISFASTTLFFSWVTILLRHPKEIGAVAKEQDSSFWVIFLVVVTAAFVSLFGIILLLQNLSTKSRQGLSLHIVLSMIAVTLSWLVIHTVFTIRYAHLYYDTSYIPQNGAQPSARGLQFPGEELPDFLDFAYFSFVLGMTFQVADINITGRRFRRLALLHGLLSFVYNTAIIALTINIISGLIGK